MLQAVDGNNRVAPELDDIALDISNLCRAVKIISSVVADQLQHPESEPKLSDYGLETQSFRIDASMLRYAVEHAAELALVVRNKMNQA